MSDDNVWLEQRLTERRALKKITAALSSPALAGERAGVQGAGTTARPANQHTEAG